MFVFKEFTLKIWRISLIGLILFVPQIAISKQSEPSYIIDVLSNYSFYDKEYDSMYPLNQIELKEQYSELSKRIIRNIDLFNNYSPYSEWFGASGDRPWSWEYSGCFSQKMAKSDYYLYSHSLKTLYKKLSNYGAINCKLSKIMVDTKLNKTERMLSLVPKSCKVEHLKSYKGSKDHYAWDSYKDGVNKGKYFISDFDDQTLEKWLSLLSCYSREQYPSNQLLEQAMVDYLKLFEHVTIIREDSIEKAIGACKVSFEQLKSFQTTPLKGMSRQCMKQ